MSRNNMISVSDYKQPVKVALRKSSYLTVMIMIENAASYLLSSSFSLATMSSITSAASPSATINSRLADTPKIRTTAKSQPR